MTTSPPKPRRLSRVLFPLLGLIAMGTLCFQLRTAITNAPRGKSPSLKIKPVKPRRIISEGRVVAYPDCEVNISTELGGTLRRLFIYENQKVRAGQLLAELQADVQREALAEAEARLTKAKVQLRYLDSELHRAENLRTAGAISEQNVNQLTRDRDAAQAELALALATTRRLTAEVAKARIVSPINGVVLARQVQIGETVPAGTHLFTIANLDRTRIEAEIDEFDAGRVKLNDTARITAEEQPALSPGEPLKPLETVVPLREGDAPSNPAP